MAQKEGINYIADDLNGHNVTKEHLKNIVIDKPTPITHNVVNGLQNLVSKAGVPVAINSPVRKDTEGNATLGLNMTVGHDPV